MKGREDPTSGEKDKKVRERKKTVTIQRQHMTSDKGSDKIRQYLASRNGKTLTVTGKYFGMYLPKFGLNKNLLIKEVTSDDGVEITDHLFVTIENYTVLEEGLKRGDTVLAEGTVYKYKKHNGGKKMLTDFSILGKSIKKVEKT